MDLLTEALKNSFVWGLLLGLLITFFIWKSGFSARRNLARELKRVEGEQKNLQNHLSTQLKVTASGTDSLLNELESLRKQNEILRINYAALQQKPGRAEQRLLQVQDIAIRQMREQAPGFAAAWEQALRKGEEDVSATESGLIKLVRRVIPGLNKPSSTLAVIENKTDHSH
jgi:hypothetical protein